MTSNVNTIRNKLIKSRLVLILLHTVDISSGYYSCKIVTTNHRTSFNIYAITTHNSCQQQPLPVIRYALLHTHYHALFFLKLRNPLRNTFQILIDLEKEKIPCVVWGRGAKIVIKVMATFPSMLKMAHFIPQHCLPITHPAPVSIVSR
jgi:hypothetical protein